MSENKRLGLSLGMRIFLLTALLVILAVGTAVVVTYLTGRRVAAAAVDSALDGSSEAQIILQAMDSQQLGLLVDQIASEPALVAYVAEAVGTPGIFGAEVDATADVVSIGDLLRERRETSGFDFAILVRPDGRVIARSDRSVAPDEDASSRAVIAEALANEPSYRAEGVWADGEELYTMAVAPIELDFDLYGFLGLAFPIDQALATDIRRVSGAHVAFLTLASQPPTVVASSNASPSADPDVARGLVAQLGELGVLSGPAIDEESHTVTLAGRPWRARARPLLDNAGVPIGAMVALAPLDVLRKPFQTILQVLIVTGVLSLLAALALSYAFSRRTLAPIARLADAAGRARQGEYDRNLPVEGGGEVGRLARSFNSLLNELRQKQDMEIYLTQLSRSLPESSVGVVGRVTLEPETREVTALAIELRRYARSRTTTAAEESADRLGRDLRRVTTAIASQNGSVGALAGHRLVAWFDGPRRSQRALMAAVRVSAALSLREDAFDDPAPPLLVLASGVALFAPTTDHLGSGTSVVGMPVQKLEGLMREATPGDLLMSREVLGELGELFAGSDLQSREGRAIFSPLPVLSLTVEEAAKLVGVDLADLEREPTEAAQQTISDIAPGATIGERFEIVAVLGVGGMGVVYRARDRELGDFVALKVLKRELWHDPLQLNRLKDEIRLARKITHPNVLRTYDFGEVDGIPYISMEYVRGRTLRFLLDQSDRFPYAAGLRLARQLCAGLAAAHAEGVIHRDIKPENLLIDHVGNALLMDFGIARPTQRVEPGQTREGWLIGTPRYLAPEQIEGIQEVDVRADLYASGVLMYELFTGSLPFAEESVVELLANKLKGDPPSPREAWPEIPPRLEQIILRCLQRDPAQRFQRATDLLDELNKLG